MHKVPKGTKRPKGIPAKLRERVEDLPVAKQLILLRFLLVLLHAAGIKLDNYPVSRSSKRKRSTRSGKKGRGHSRKSGKSRGSGKRKGNPRGLIKAIKANPRMSPEAKRKAISKLERRL